MNISTPKALMNTYTMKRETLESIGEIVGGILVMILAVVFFWLCLLITPDQYSAECEYQREQVQKGGVL